MNTLPKVVRNRSKRLGRGYGSGKGGHTSSRGQKGQKSRGSLGVLFEGLKVRKSLLHRLPLQRGKGKFQGRTKPIAVDISYLNSLADGTEVTIESLAKAGIVKLDDAKKFGVKILGETKLEKKLTVNLNTSAGARKLIEKAGGTLASK